MEERNNVALRQLGFVNPTGGICRYESVALVARIVKSAQYALCDNSSNAVWPLGAGTLLDCRQLVQMESARQKYGDWTVLAVVSGWRVIRPSLLFDWQEAAFEFPIVADSSNFVIPARYFVYPMYVRL
jgi:hypothetical protein